MRSVGGNVIFYMAPEIVGDIGNMTSEEASDVIGLVYGVVVYNEKWKEVSQIATQLISKDPSAITLTGGEPIKMNSIEMENLKSFVKENTERVFVSIAYSANGTLVTSDLHGNSIFLHKLSSHQHVLNDSDTGNVDLKTHLYTLIDILTWCRALYCL